MKIRSRIWLGYLLVILTLAVALLLQTWGLNSFMASVKDIEGAFKNPVTKLGLLRDQLDELRSRFEFYLNQADYIFSPEWEDLLAGDGRSDQWKASFENQEVRFDEAERDIQLLIGELGRQTRELKLTDPSTDQARILQRIQTAWQRLQDDSEKTLSGVREKNLTAASSDFDRWKTQSDGLEERLQALQKSLQDQLSRTVDDFESLFSWIDWVSAALTAFALASSLLVSIWLVRSISVPLRKLNLAHSRWQEEDFDYRVEVKNNDELTALAESGNRMAHRLSELENMKRDFVSHVSHELKSPLNSLLSGVRLMQSGRAGEISPRQGRLLNGMQETGDRLNRMIGNLLDYSRIEAGIFSVRTSPEDLVQVVSSYLEEVEVRVQEAGLELRRCICADPVPVLCDRNRVQQVVANFLDNAIKFSPPQAAIQVTVEKHEEAPEIPSWAMGQPPGEQPVATICVSDAGPGVPVPRRGEIFSKFHQLEPEHSRKGVGLGLAICRSIVEAQRGLIWVEDSPLGGSRFCFLLPLDGQRGPAAE